MRAEWKTLAALGALAPYGPALRPNRLRPTLKTLGQKRKL